MAAERETFKWGGVVFPLTGSTVNTSLQDADPVVFYLLDYLSTVLQTHLGARWAAECIAAGLPDIATSIVGCTVCFDPAPFLTENQIKFPLLSLYRVSDNDANDHSLQIAQSETEYRLSWSMPPLTAGQAERLIPFLGAVGKCIRQRISEGGDASYQGGARVLALAGLTSFGTTSAKYGGYLASNELYFPTLDMVAVGREQQRPVDGAFDAFQGADVAIDHTDPQGIVTDLVDVRVQTARAFSLGFDSGFS